MTQPDPVERVERAEAISLALVVVLESLSPLERAVFVLHESFGYAHTEIADILGRNEAAIRQLATRARNHVQARRPRFKVCGRIESTTKAGDAALKLLADCPLRLFCAEGARFALDIRKSCRIRPHRA